MYDRLSPSDTRTLVDVHHNAPGMEAARPPWVAQQLTFLTDDILPCLQPGTVVMVEGFNQDSFFERVGVWCVWEGVWCVWGGWGGGGYGGGLQPRLVI